MKEKKCPRSWEAEAVEDGRLGPTESASFKKHATQCAVCRGDVEALEWLRSAALELPDAPMSELEHRRMRAELLRRANTAFIADKRNWRTTWVLASAASVLMVVAGLALMRSGDGTTGQPITVATSAPEFSAVEADPDVVWSEQATGSVQRVRLDSGKLTLDVDELSGAQRFFVDMPDSRIEVRGTRFTVDVTDGRTRSVEVTEGVVAFTLEGSSERLLRAGESWHRTETARAEGAISGRAGAEPGPAARPGIDERDEGTVDPTAPLSAEHEPASATPLRAAKRAAPLHDSAGSSKRAAVPSDGTPATTETSQASDRSSSGTLPSSTPADDETEAATDPFARGVAAYHRGAYSEADALLERFQKISPSDPRGEDAAFLRAMARHRLGDAAGASRLAEDYLRRYPNGLRKAEAGRLVEKP